MLLLLASSLLLTSEAFHSMRVRRRPFAGPSPSRRVLSQQRGGGAAAAATTSQPPAPLPESSSSRRLPLPVVSLLAAAFLNLLGFTMATPLNPILGAHFDLEGPALGSLTSAYPFGMLFGLLVWPSMSDAKGMRKPILVTSLAGSGIGLAMQALCLFLQGPLWAFLSLRAVSGLFAGASPVAKAFLSDMSTRTDDLPRFLAYREASATLAFIVGPSFGGLLHYLTGSLAAVVATTALASVLAATVVALACPRGSSFYDDDEAPGRRPNRQQQKNTEEETGPPRGEEEKKGVSGSSDSSSLRPQTNEALAASLESLEKMPSQCPLGTRLFAAVATIVAVSSLENAGSATWDAFGAVVAADRFGWGPRAVGGMLTVGACVSFAVSTALFGRVARSIGIVATAVAGLSLVGVGLAGVGLAGAHPGLFLASAALYQLGRPLYNPTLPTLLLRCVPPARRGFAMGVDSAFNTAARAVAPIALGFVLHRRGPEACFLCAGGLVLAAAAVAALRGIQVRRGRLRDGAPLATPFLPTTTAAPSS